MHELCMIRHILLGISYEAMITQLSLVGPRPESEFPTFSVLVQIGHDIAIEKPPRRVRNRHCPKRVDILCFHEHIILLKHL
jgi:hypothetical protein